MTIQAPRIRDKKRNSTFEKIGAYWDLQKKFCSRARPEETCERWISRLPASETSNKNNSETWEISKVTTITVFVQGSSVWLLTRTMQWPLSNRQSTQFAETALPEACGIKLETFLKIRKAESNRTTQKLDSRHLLFLYLPGHAEMWLLPLYQESCP